MNKKYYWLKLKKDFFTDKRIKKLRTIAGGDTYTIIYLKMQLLSLNDDGYLYFDNVEETFEEEIALEIDENVEDVKVTINFLMRNGLLEQKEVDEYELTETRQCIGSETASAERVRKHRLNQKMLQCNTNVTKCNIEKEIEKDIDIDKKEIYKEKRFKKPSLEEIKTYCEERNNGINANAFYDFYESKNWMIGKNKMKDYKACIRTWEQRQSKQESLPKWFNEEVKSENLTKEQQEEIDKMMEEFK